jgi:DsbC/DsbD-like thiol-disulfide interchange protein
VIAGALSVISPPSFAQGNVLSVAPPDRLPAKPGANVQSKLSVQLRSGYHVNSNTPSDEYLIPLRLTWTGGPLETVEVVFPKPQMEKYSFSEKPLSVFTGDFELITKFKVAANAPPGPVTITGKLRYQACNDRMCLPPKNVDITLPVDIK